VKKFVEESWLVLVMGVVFACVLAGTQMSVSDTIKANQQRALNEAVEWVVQGAAKTEEDSIDGNTVFKCCDADGKLVGWAVKATGTGFIDKITLVVGLSPDAEKITGLKVIEDLETPGLGNKIRGEWADQYKDRDATKKLKVVKGAANPANHEIAAITGATWSSRYTTDIVNDVIERIRPELAKRAAQR
jgi:electron transport complex protein RnfG